MGVCLSSVDFQIKVDIRFDRSAFVFGSVHVVGSNGCFQCVCFESQFLDIILIDELSSSSGVDKSEGFDSFFSVIVGNLVSIVSRTD